ncbi:TetR/AcrR family transcriptional regulator [Alterisphingorhabdus coralli]|uniref:TetR family transcriptional regulator n=1 Tax=Alterisphingorhabdus coralli TaxID=3071408 RepID=A0AA97I2A9_9SPHN|nr:TetR family transcriptional regulator [Parasphingorhabdus sp. SCSIO 66989]WOE76200.1 TetR family transcriptional regulator [Parasphingorhabdus sp. SCSIO 66989]
MPRPQLDADEIRNSIMETAEELIRQRGAVDFSVSEIATACGMSQSNLYRYFESKEAFYEAMAGRWFEELNTLMEETIASELPAKEKMFAFFANRLAIKRARFEDDPKLFESYMEIGHQHFEVVRGYIDLADHYLAVIVAEAMAEGHFEDMEIDHTVSLINLMVQPFCNPDIMMNMWPTSTDDNLRIVLDTIFIGLKGKSPVKLDVAPDLRIAS